MALFGGPSLPLNRKSVVLLHSMSKIVENTQEELRARIPLFSSFPIPVSSRSVALRHTEPEIIQASDPHLGSSISLLCERKPFLQRRLVAASIEMSPSSNG